MTQAGIQTAQTGTDGRGDFDFLFGHSRIHHRRLTRLADPDCTEWMEFDSRAEARPILGGLGNIDFLVVDQPDGQPFEGMTLRLYDPESGLWRIWWASTSRPGYLDPPVAGRFTNGHGKFSGEDVLDGRKLLVHYDWTDITPTTSRWSQRFSFDDGKTWGGENWIMTRTLTG